MMLPSNTIKAKLGLQPNGEALAYFTDACYKHMDKYVPYETGALRQNVEVKPGAITYQSPYAHYQYVGHKYVMANGKSAYYSEKYGYWSDPGKKKTDSGKPLVYHTNGTGAYWDKQMVSAEINQVIKETEKFIRGRAKGK